MPPTTLGVFLVVQTWLPGSTRSGLKQRWKSSPTSRPDSSSAGSRTSRVVPGYVVDSRTMSCPFRSPPATAWDAERMYDTSGSRVLESGVGTQMETTSHSARRLMSVVASSNPFSRSSATSAEGTSRMWERPAFTPSTTLGFTSNPMTCMPASAASTTSGSPT